MITFKQLEALVWIAELGGFDAAADKLNTSQPAISKRILELESTFSTPIFDRTRRSSFLTPKGAEMLELAKQLISLRETFVERFSQPEVLVSTLRIGVTGLTTMTWLPNWMSRIKNTYPLLQIDISVASGSELREQLELNKLDIVVVPDAGTDARFVRTYLASLDIVWVCKRDFLPRKKITDVDQFTLHTVYMQNDKTIVDLVMKAWLDGGGAVLPKVRLTDSLQSLIAWTLSGFGISLIPSFFLKSFLSTKQVQKINTLIPLPSIPYAVMYRHNTQSSLIAKAAEIATECCDFSVQFRAE